MYQIDEYSDRPAATPRRRTLTIVAQDPKLRVRRRIVTASVDVPVDRLEPGPRTHRFHVVDFDATTGVLAPPADLADPEVLAEDVGWVCLDRYAAPDPTVAGDEADRFPAGYNETLLEDRQFHAQNVYAIAARTLAAFEFALGRRVSWGFPGHQLYLVPHAMVEGNAHYSREDRGVFFGYLPQPDGSTVYTCLSHDVVCHEVTHAILDGLRQRFLEPALPDQLAFHEALSDIVAILSVFSLRELVATALDATDPEATRIAASSVSRNALAHSVLLSVASEFGEALSGVRGSALRRSLELTERPYKAELLGLPEFREPHRRGEIVVAAVLDTLVGMWTRRLEAITHRGTLNRDRAAEEGAKAAGHLLTMVIRSLDYAPTVELEFEDVLDAIITADETVAPDDEHGYRDALRTAFLAFGIGQPVGRMVDCSKLPVPFRYAQINASALRSSPQEAFRFLWQNLEPLQLSSQWHIQIESLHPVTRVGPDGLVLQEVVANYVQVLELSAAEARGLSANIAQKGVEPKLDVPAELANDTPLQLWGGGVLIFDQFGRLKLHQHKRLNDWERQSRRLRYLVEEDLFDTTGRLGFSLGTGTGMAFADLHLPDAWAAEAW